MVVFRVVVWYFIKNVKLYKNRFLKILLQSDWPVLMMWSQLKVTHCENKQSTIYI